MQTFLPYAEDYKATAKVLDNKRLGKQRVETYQILKALLGESKGWVNHPATRMWKNNEYQLFLYQNEICEEWSRRGFADTVMQKTTTLILKHSVPVKTELPYWMTNPAVQITHQANLFIKNPVAYPFFEHQVSVYKDLICCPEKCTYFWPLHKSEVNK
jgi:hypothetical protein